MINLSCGGGLFWVRVGRLVITAKDTRRSPLLFSERMQAYRCLRVGNYYFQIRQEHIG